MSAVVTVVPAVTEMQMEILNVASQKKPLWGLSVMVAIGVAIPAQRHPIVEKKE